MAVSSSIPNRLAAVTIGGVNETIGPENSGKHWTELALRAARSICTILITGETGVGKGHLANWLHASSDRGDKPFIPVNCGAIPDTLIDSQLFGHVRGAFTGATADQLGLIRASDGGTLFLDEVSELPPSAQRRLLRLLQEREVQPVGMAWPVTVNVRVIAATNADLHERVETVQFREDLLFRLDVIRLHVKPLRERPTELLSFLSEFNVEFAGLYRQPKLVFDKRAMNALKSHQWPGNVRQLRTLVERLHVLCPGEIITVRELQEVGHLNHDAPIPGQESLGQIKIEAVRRVLEDSGGSVSKAAAVFGVHRSTIYRWLRQA